MSTVTIADFHPDGWITGVYEEQAIDHIFSKIKLVHKHKSNLFINATWFGPHFKNNTGWSDLMDLIGKGVKFDNLFYLVMIDPDNFNEEQFKLFVDKIGNPKVYRLGSVAETPNAQPFSIFSYMMGNEFKTYTEEELELTNVKYKFISYNRKPKMWRGRFVDALRKEKLLDGNIVSLGKGSMFDPVIIEENINVIDASADDDVHGITNDIMTLGNMDYWKNHFLNVVCETANNQDSEVFISEKIFKPIIGMRPFIINGNVHTYDWLRCNGFRTFNHIFPGDIENPETYEKEIVKVLAYINSLSPEALLTIYNDIRDDLVYNRNRFFEFAAEQEAKMKDLIPWED